MGLRRELGEAVGGEGNGNPLQYSCLENPMDGGAWWAAVHGVPKSWTRPEWLHFPFFTFMHWRRKWQTTLVFLPGESQGRQSLVGCCLWGCRESDTTEATWQQQHLMRLYWTRAYVSQEGSRKSPILQGFYETWRLLSLLFLPISCLLMFCDPQRPNVSECKKSG